MVSKNKGDFSESDGSLAKDLGADVVERTPGKSVELFASWRIS